MPPKSGVHAVRESEIRLLQIEPLINTWPVTELQTQPWRYGAAWAPARGRYAPLAGDTDYFSFPKQQRIP